MRLPQRMRDKMLKVRFVVEFDKDGKITQILRYCDVSRPTCEGCRFEEWCDRVMDKLKELVKEEGIESV